MCDTVRVVNLWGGTVKHSQSTTNRTSHRVSFDADELMQFLLSSDHIVLADYGIPDDADVYFSSPDPYHGGSERRYSLNTTIKHGGGEA